MNQNITDVRGFKCWGAHSGVKSMRRDLAIIYSEVPCTTAAVYTQNTVQAEPIKLTKKHLSDHRAQVIVCNAGNANACTGKQGREGAEAMAAITAKELGISPDLVIVASTGLIGDPFPTEDIVGGIKENIHKLSDDHKAGSFAANAILTTDTFAKEGFLSYEIEDTTVNMAGIAKGSGMIHPNMATMLSFIVTDVDIDEKLLQELLVECTERSFNMITVDGDSSTNDMVTVMANGLAKNKKITSKKDPHYPIFKEKLLEMMMHLAKLIVSDGEGASKFVEYHVRKAKDEDTARKLVKAMSGSTLVKTALFGRDPNWGRIVAACGNAGVDFDYEKADLYLGDAENLIQVLKEGSPVAYDRNFLKKLLRESHIRIVVDVHTGRFKSTGWGTDLTTDYVLFNSVYTT